jgi:hypothetical protein
VILREREREKERDCKRKLKVTISGNNESGKRDLKRRAANGDEKAVFERMTASF